MFTASRGRVDDLLQGARHLTELLSQAEQNHGGLIGVDILKAANTLRLELSRWPAKSTRPFDTAPEGTVDEPKFNFGSGDAADTDPLGR